MKPVPHWAIHVDNDSHVDLFIEDILTERLGTFKALHGKTGAVFSQKAMEQLIVEEERHELSFIRTETGQTLRSLSSGQKKKALLAYLQSKNPDFLVLDNPFDNLDTQTQKDLAQLLEKQKNRVSMIQLVSRKDDVLPFIDVQYYLVGKALQAEAPKNIPSTKQMDALALPRPLFPMAYNQRALIELKGVNVAFGKTKVLKNIHWTIDHGSFWQLIGKNGSGKTTLLSMITGENPKGYGQELFIFGQRKGSGESIWDIKKKIGYYTPSMTDKFSGLHSVENMLISGFNDSIGLYQNPTEAQKQRVAEWLALLDMETIKTTLFCDLTTGQQRLLMTARAMVKHPLLLILDEPTASLDDASAKLLIQLVNKMAKESDTAIIFVSHRNEPGLEPRHIFELQMTPEGSVGKSFKNHG